MLQFRLFQGGALIKEKLRRSTQRGQGRAKLVRHVREEVTEKMLDGFFLANVAKNQRYMSGFYFWREQVGAGDTERSRLSFRN